MLSLVSVGHHSTLSSHDIHFLIFSVWRRMIIHVLLLLRSVWFISVNFAVFNSFHGVGHDGIMFIFCLNSVLLWMSDNQLIHAYLFNTCFISRAVVANGTRNLRVQADVSDTVLSFSLAISQITGLIGHMVVFLSVFWGSSALHMVVLIKILPIVCLSPTICCSHQSPSPLLSPAPNPFLLVFSISPKSFFLLLSCSPWPSIYG